MNFRLTAGLFLTVFVLVVILLIMSYTSDKKETVEVLARELAVADLGTDKVDSIQFERPDGAELLIVKTDKDRNTWQIQKPITAAADAAKVRPVIDALLKAKPTPYAGISGNPAAHGLDPAGLKITLRAGDKSSAINLGDVTLDSVVFATTSSQPKRPMAVRRGELDVLFREAKDGTAGALAKWTSDYRTSAVFPSDTRFAGDDVASVKLDLPNKKKVLSLVRPQSNGPWKFDSPDQTGWGNADTEGDAASSPGTFTGVRRLLGALTSISAATPGDFIDQPKDLKEYGLNADNPDLVRVDLKTRDGQSATVFVGNREAATPPKFPPGMPPPPTPGGKVYVRVEGVPGVIRATAGDLSGLTGVIADPAPLRDRTLVQLDRAKVDGIDITLAGQPADKPTKLRRTGELREWKLYGGPGDPQPAFDAAVKQLLDVVLAPRTIKDFPKSDPANFAAVSATVSVWADGFNPPAGEKAEPARKEKADPVKVEFGRKDGDLVYVRRTLPGQPPAEFTIPAHVKVGQATETADTLAAVGKSRLDLLDRTLPSFSDSTPVRITATGAGSGPTPPPYTLVRDDRGLPGTKGDAWRFDAPAPRKGHVADTETVRNELIYALGNIKSDFGRYVKEEPTAEDLARYGLTPPRLTVSVDMPPNTEPKQITFEFGKDVEAEPDRVYARVPGRAAVFTVQRRVFDRFAGSDLRDRVLFRAVPADEVNRVVLLGWGNVLGNTPMKLVVEKKGGVWSVPPAPPPAPGAPPPAPVAVDSARVAAFVEMVTKSRVRTFEKGPIEPRYGFTNPNEFLDVRLEWPGGVVVFRLGASSDGGTTYFGETGWLPQSDPVFTIDAAQLKPFKEKPGGFSK